MVAFSGSKRKIGKKGRGNNYIAVYHRYVSNKEATFYDGYCFLLQMKVLTPLCGIRTLTLES